MLHLFRGRGQQKEHKQRTREATRVLPETVWTSYDNDPMPSGIPPEGSVVVTISRQLGSGGAEIGRIVAQERGLHYVDHQIIDEGARRLGVQEKQTARQDEYTARGAERTLQGMPARSPFLVH